MSRGARLAVGLTSAGALLLVCLVSVVVGAVLAGGGESSFFEDLDEAYVDEYMTATVQAEVLDVDDELGWTWVDVRFDAGGEVVVTGFDWTGSRLLQLGDTIEVAYDPADPEYAAAAPEPAPTDLAPSDPAPDPSVVAGVEEDAAGTPPSAVVAFWVAGTSGVLALVAVVLTVLWSSRAPEPRAPQRSAGPPGYWAPAGPGHAPVRQPEYVPTAAQPYVPPASHPYAPPAQPYAPPPSAPTGWGSPSG